MSADPMVSVTYRFRWPLAGFLLVLVFALFGGGIQRLTAFSAQVDSLKDHQG